MYYTDNKERISEIKKEAYQEDLELYYLAIQLYHNIMHSYTYAIAIVYHKK